MTRKDFELIAKVLLQSKPEGDKNTELYRWNVVVLNFAKQLQAENPRFNSAKFIKACRG